MFNLGSRARPYIGAVTLTALLLTGGGIYSAMRMPSGVYPEVQFPRLAIVAKKPGLSIRNMEAQVTRPLEQAVSSVIGVVRVRCKTIRGGCDISVDLAPGTDARRAEQLAWNRIGAVRSQMPPDVELALEQMTPSVFPIMSVVLTGGDSPAQLHDYAFFQLAPRIKTVPDVLYTEVAGGDVREIEVIARPEDLLNSGLTAADLADQIGRAHRLEPVGRIESEPFAFQVIVNNQGETMRQIEDVIVTTRANEPLRVRDVADVKAMHRDRVQSVGFEGHDAVVVMIKRRVDGNTVSVSNGVRQLLEHHPFPKNIQWTVVYDQAQFVSSAIDNVRDAIVVGGIFSILILLGFLRSWRATLISALALPTSLAITFLFLYWSGQTLNLMSLGGLAVAIGLIIDDTVVVVENIARHLQKRSTDHATGMDPIDAAASEITGAVIGSTLTTVLVFVPLAFIVGVYGQFFAALSWSLSIAVLVSMVVSLTLVPVFAAKFLAGKPIPEPGPIYRRIASIYERMLQVALRFPWLTLTASLAAVAVGVILYTGIPNPLAQPEPGEAPKPLFAGLETGLMPTMDEGAFVLDYLAPMGTPLDRTEAMARTIEEILSKNPDVQVYVRRTGTELGMFATKTNRGDIQVVLRPLEDDPISLLRKPVRPEFARVEKELEALGRERAGADASEKQVWEKGKRAICQKYRRRSDKEVRDEIEDELKEHFAEHQLKCELIPIMADELSDLSGANRPIEVKLFGPEYAELRHLGEEVGDKLEKEGKGRGFKEVSSILEGNPDLMVLPDRVQAGKLGMTVQEIERQLKAIYLGQIATQVQESSERLTDVRVRYPDSIRFGEGRFFPSSILDQWLLIPEGSLPGGTRLNNDVALAGLARAVPLSALASVERVRTPDEQVRENMQPVVIVSSMIEESEAGLGSMIADIRRWMPEINMASGYRWELGGHYLQQQEMFHSFTVVMVVAILLVFIMLAFQFRSVVLPLLIFLTQPLSLVSGLLALRLTNTPLNVSSYMGAILLIGLDMKNGILLVEYIQQLRGEGMELREALLVAGRTRFRPILMTSLAAILGLFPLALGIGPGAQMQQPLAIMVIGGLTANMLFTRVVIPVGYLVLERNR